MDKGIWKDSQGKEFTVRLVDHNMDGTWIHYRDANGNEYSCLVDAFKERFTRVENVKR